MGTGHSTYRYINTGIPHPHPPALALPPPPIPPPLPIPPPPPPARSPHDDQEDYEDEDTPEYPLPGADYLDADEGFIQVLLKLYHDTLPLSSSGYPPSPPVYPPPLTFPPPPVRLMEMVDSAASR